MLRAVARRGGLASEAAYPREAAYPPQAAYLWEADQHEQGEDVGVPQLERQLLDAVVCEGGDDVTPQGGTAEGPQDLRHGARPVQAHPAARRELH